MKRHVVLAWELGAALGHVMGLRPLITGFLAKNIGVSIVGRNLASIQQVLGDLDVSYYQSPVFLSERHEHLKVTHSYSDIIHDLGYQADHSLLGLVKGWCNLFALIKPDLIICDHSPTALLASKCLDLRTCTFGNGFFLPPDTQLPVLFKTSDVSIKKEVNKRYNHVMDNINGVLKKWGKEPIDVLFDIFRSSKHFLCTFTEIDHYERKPNTLYYGPRNTVDKGRVVRLKPSEQVAFAYLQPHTSLLMPVIQSLAKLPIKSVLYIPKLPSETEKQIRAYKNIEVYPEPINISRIFEHTVLLINNASHGLVGEALLWGKPSIVLPTQLEQNLLAKKVSAQKLSIALNAESKIDTCAAIQFALNNQDLKSRLEAVKEKYTNYTHQRAFSDILTECLSLID